MQPNFFAKWKADIDNAVANVCLRIIKEPLLYFSEADLQILLVEELRKIRRFRKTYPTQVFRGKDSKGKYQTSLIHREYGGGGGTRIDIVILDPKDVEEINNVNLTIDKKYLHPAFAFELGTEKTQNIASHLKKDLKKLSKKTKEIGYIIHFYKDVTQAKIGSMSHQKTEEKIERQFKEVFAIKDELRGPNIKILAILLRTYKNQKKMMGKCEIFNGCSLINKC